MSIGKNTRKPVAAANTTPSAIDIARSVPAMRVNPVKRHIKPFWPRAASAVRPGPWPGRVGLTGSRRKRKQVAWREFRILVTPHGHSAVDDDLGTGDEARFVGRQKQRG